MKTLFKSSLLAGVAAALVCSQALAQGADPEAAAETARDVAAESAGMVTTQPHSANAPPTPMASPPPAFSAPPQFDAYGNLILPPGATMTGGTATPTATAAEPPAPPVDQRIKQLVYNEGDVYTITTRYGYQTNIVISPKEEIQTISVGDKSVWQIIPAGNRIFIRPMEENAITNMTVLTNKHSYQFDIKSLGPAETEGNIYVAQFIYPEDMIAAAQAAAAQAAQTAQPMPQFDPYGNPMPMAAPQFDAYGNPIAAAPMPAPMPAGATPYDTYGAPAAAPAYPAEPAAPVAAAPVAAPAPAYSAAPAPMPAPMPAPVAASAPPPLPANIPFGGPTPPPAVPVEDKPVPKAATAKAGKQPTLAELNSAPPPPTKYVEVPYDAQSVVVPTVAPAVAPAAAAPAAAPLNIVPMVPANANFNYTYSGPDALAPLQVFDDGKMTWLKYASVGRELPDVFILDAKGNVTSVPHEMRGEFMVVDAIAPEMIVKNTSGSVHVYNETLAPQ